MDKALKTALFNITLNSKAHLLLKNDRDLISWAIASPDGRSVAIKRLGPEMPGLLANF